MCSGQSDELSFKTGDLIMLISRIGEGEWLRGRTMQGIEGIFPKSFVEIVVSISVERKGIMTLLVLLLLGGPASRCC